MTSYRVHNLESAPQKSKPALEGLQKAFGVIPNLAATMAESPVLIGGFVGAFTNFSTGTFDGAQRQVCLLTNAVANRCEWAVAFHSTMALKEGVAAADVVAIREQRVPKDQKHAALSVLARALIERRGAIEDRDVAAFEAAGFVKAQVLEVIAGLAVSVMANYAGNTTHPPLEDPFKAQLGPRDQAYFADGEGPGGDTFR